MHCRPLRFPGVLIRVLIDPVGSGRRAAAGEDGQRALDWIVYILKCADGTLYTGITNDLGRRMSEHETGQGARYTRGRGPFQLVYHEIRQNRGEASRREMEIKALRRDQKLAMVSRVRS